MRRKSTIDNRQLTIDNRQLIPLFANDQTLVSSKLTNFVENDKMERLISVTYPESLAFSLKMENQEFESEIKTISLIKLYELGKISSGLAAKLLNLNRVDFLELLQKYNVSYFHKGLENELESDLSNA